MNIRYPIYEGVYRILTIQVPLTLFERNFPVAFPIFNRPYLADAPYRNDKIPPKFLVCCFL